MDTKYQKLPQEEEQVAMSGASNPVAVPLPVENSPSQLSPRVQPNTTERYHDEAPLGEDLFEASPLFTDIPAKKTWFQKFSQLFNYRRGQNRILNVEYPKWLRQKVSSITWLNWFHRFLYLLVIGLIIAVIVLSVLISRPVRRSYSGKPASGPWNYNPGRNKHNFDIGLESKHKNFYFTHQLEQKPSWSSNMYTIQTSGDVIIDRSWTGPSVSVDLGIQTSHLELRSRIKVKVTDTGIDVVRTGPQEFIGLQFPRIYITAKIYVNPSTSMSDFTINSLSMPIRIRDFAALNATTISLEANARIETGADSLLAKQLRLKSGGDIKGRFPMVENLNIETRGGEVQFQLEPKELGDTAIPGSLMIRTAGGNVKLDSFPHYSPSRNFTLDVATQRGSVSGKYLLGSASVIETTTGNVNLELISTTNVERRSVDIKSHQGNIKTIIRDTNPLKQLDTRYSTWTGRIDAFFPTSWKGVGSAGSKFSTVNILGPGVEVISRKNPFSNFGRYMRVKKGDGPCISSAESETGPVLIQIE